MNDADFIRTVLDRLDSIGMASATDRLMAILSNVPLINTTASPNDIRVHFERKLEEESEITRAIDLLNGLDKTQFRVSVNTVDNSIRVRRV